MAGGKHYIAVPFEEGSPAQPPGMPLASSTPRNSPLPENPAAIPWGVRFFRLFPLPKFLSRLTAYRISILLLTYLFYVSYHLARRPLGVVKNVLRQSCVNMTRPPELTECEFQLRNETWCAWEPFDKDSQKLFSMLDFTYRFSYAVGMLFAGYIAERTDLRIFISCGMVLAGAWGVFGGLAYFWKVHSYSFFVIAQFFGGIFQGTGWPSVVPLMGNWFGKKRLGFIFGVWNSHTSVGNILGSVIAGIWVNDQWGYSFVVPGLIIAVCGVTAYLFVVVNPEDVGLPSPDHSEEDSINDTTTTDASNMSMNEQGETKKSKELELTLEHPHERKPITMRQALKIPGVVEFSMCLFFSKAVYYTFFFWLPVYIKDTAKGIDSHGAADLSAVFDAGGIIGGILAGAVSDATGGSATVCGAMFILAIPPLALMIGYASSSFTSLIVLLVITGLFVNGPYALITTAVSTDLGTRPSLTKNTKALATVAAVIDGMGSLGSALGPLIAGLLSIYDWMGVFYFLIAAQIVALLCLVRLIYREILHWISKSRAHKKNGGVQSRNGHLHFSPALRESNFGKPEKELLGNGDSRQPSLSPA